MLEACARLGLDTREILRAAKLDPITVADPDARIPIEQASAICGASLRSLHRHQRVFDHPIRDIRPQLRAAID